MQLKNKKETTISSQQQQQQPEHDNKNNEHDNINNSSSNTLINKQSSNEHTKTTAAAAMVPVAQKRARKDIHSIAARIIKNMNHHPHHQHQHQHQHSHHSHHPQENSHFCSNNYSSDESSDDDDDDDDDDNDDNFSQSTATTTTTTSSTTSTMHHHHHHTGLPSMATIAAAASFLDTIHKNSNSISRSASTSATVSTPSSSMSGGDIYFWQYNPLLKGPKRKKVLAWPNTDPHLHKEFLDPVVSLLELNKNTQALAASSPLLLNKFRMGDTNDVTPNTSKLLNLGLQINAFHVNSTALQHHHSCSSSSSSPSPHSLGGGGDQLALERFKLDMRREKNKIASRACRLKKKAQHEANKIKLHGLIQEHAQLIETIHLVRQLIKLRVLEPQKLPADKRMADLFHEICQQKLKTKVAGNSDGYVNAALLISTSHRSSTNNNNNNVVNSLSSDASC